MCTSPTAAALISGSRPPLKLIHYLSTYVWRNQGGLYEPDLAGDGFLKFIQHLRIVFLQDLTGLQPRFPAFSFYSYTSFYSQDWEDYARVVQVNIEEATEPADDLCQGRLV